MAQQFTWLLFAWIAALTPQPVTGTRFSEYILAPAQRTVRPSLHSYTGSISCSHGELRIGDTSYHGITLSSNSSITFDFGINIGGPVRFDVASVSTPNETIAVTFTESSLFISPDHCDGGFGDWDDPLFFSITQPGEYAADKAHQRGGFRYATVSLNSTGVVTIQDFSVDFTASPEVSDLRDYKGWFNCDSEKLNRVWYAGVYTNQLCTADPASGNTLFIGPQNWYSNYTIANGTSVIMDGAKRDRLVWPGDIIISAPTIAVSTSSLDGTKNALDSLFVMQDDQGRLPYSGKPFSTMTPEWFWSFNYHLYTLQDLYIYYLYTGDLDYLKAHWIQFKKAIQYSLGTIDDSGMANVSNTNDWGRYGMGGHNIEANAVLYHTLDIAIQLAETVNDTADLVPWKAAMEGIKSTVNEVLWDAEQNLFFDNDTVQTQEAVRPQDGNVWAILAGIVSEERAAAISTALMERWVQPFGAPAPEAGITVSPFITSLELRAHFLAGFPERAINLMEWMWADFMLDDPRMTNSTLIEGYSIDGRIHYPPYSDIDQRISHAHGWATGPTSALTTYVAGLQLETAGGNTWLIHPQLGSLKRVTAGYETPHGIISATWKQANSHLTGNFETPRGTSGTLILPHGGGKTVVEGCNGRISPSETTDLSLKFSNIPGGRYNVHVE